MTHATWARRTFLKNAGHGLATLLLLSGISVMAQNTGKRTVPAANPRASVHLNVRDFGATGDGKTKDTLAIQQVLDRCSVLGGGEVLVPPGDYLTGAIALKSNTLLRLDEGATLNGSPDMADYPLTQVRWEGKWIKGYLGMVSAMDAENIGIVGKGKVVGSPETP